MDNAGAAMSWDISPTKFTGFTTEQHRQLCVKIGIDVDARLVHTTPVKEGRAKNNWMPSIGSPSTATTEKTSDAPLGAGIGKGAGVFSSAPPFPVLYITNNLPYIVPLNSGTSKQAPENFVEISVSGYIDGL